MHRPFLLSAFIGIALIFIGLLIYLVGPGPSDNLLGGFLTPVVAFEFATKDEQVTQIFGPTQSTQSEDMMQKMTDSTQLDFLFLILYGSFLLSFALICTSITQSRGYYFAAGLAILAPLFDILENIQMFSIMEQIAAGQTQFELGLIHFFTWAKWGSLALAFALLVPFFQSTGNFGRFLSLFTIINLALGTAAYIWPGLFNEIFALTTVLMFLLMIIFSFTYRRQYQANPLA